MTNDELKKKIVEILEETEHEWTEEKNGYILQIFYDKLADALIAAGLKFDTVVSHTATFDIIQHEQISRLEIRVAEAEHRAARAEREAIILSKWLAEKTRKDYPYQAWLEAAQKQAKKELAEEKKE